MKGLFLSVEQAESIEHSRVTITGERDIIIVGQRIYVNLKFAGYDSKLKSTDI